MRNIPFMVIHDTILAGDPGELRAVSSREVRLLAPCSTAACRQSTALQAVGCVRTQRSAPEHRTAPSAGAWRRTGTELFGEPHPVRWSGGSSPRSSLSTADEPVRARLEPPPAVWRGLPQIRCQRKEVVTERKALIPPVRNQVDWTHMLLLPSTRRLETNQDSTEALTAALLKITHTRTALISSLRNQTLDPSEHKSSLSFRLLQPHVHTQQRLNHSLEKLQNTEKRFNINANSGSELLNCVNMMI